MSELLRLPDAQSSPSNPANRGIGRQRWWDNRCATTRPDSTTLISSVGNERMTVLSDTARVTGASIGLSGHADWCSRPHDASQPTSLGVGAFAERGYENGRFRPR
jgi:hypothetical protein